MVNIKVDVFIFDYLIRWLSLMIGGVLVYVVCLFIVVCWLFWGWVKRVLGLVFWWGVWFWFVNGLVVLVNYGNVLIWLVFSGFLIV